MTVKTDLDRENIILLWKEAFGDDDSYINGFLDVVQYEGRFFGLYGDSDELVCMLFLLDMPLKTQEGSLKSAYMYACATRIDCRGKGLFKQLYANAKQALRKEEYDCVFCVPANEGLFEFYKKLGFDKAFCRRKIYAENDGQACKLDFKKESEAFGVYKNSIPKDICCPIKSKRVFDLSLEAAKAELYSFDGGYFIYDGESVCEILSLDKNEDEILKEAVRFFGKELFAYTHPLENDREKYAALCVLSDIKISDNVYANLLMD